MSNVPALQLKPKEERRLLRGHCWAYRNEFARLPDLEDGAVVDVVSSRGRFVGRGFFQAEGGIAVRIIARRQTALDADFLAGLVTKALAFRERVFPGEDVYRWVFGESDGLPGLVADRYGGVVSMRSECAFYGTRLDDLAAVFMAQPDVEGVRAVVKGAVRHFGVVPRPVECGIDGFSAALDLDAGQKTGLFLDQRVNCRQVRQYASGTQVLDGHCYHGWWSLHAARAGALSVLGVDTSSRAIDCARENARRNGLDERCVFECTSVAEAFERGDRYGVVILDPPALAKTRRHGAKALGLYQALNRDAMLAVEPGGILITSSCSHFVDREAFLEALKRAAAAAGRQVWLLDIRGAGPDHPVSMAMPETAYLKCVTLRVL